ncbi:hypothetical protein JCM19238_4412 [Vibrio ponticus]|nr:hypothetical protein JCM19238_4412 [Vibrio ponticus]
MLKRLSNLKLAQISAPVAAQKWCYVKPSVVKISVNSFGVAQAFQSVER